MPMTEENWQHSIRPSEMLLFLRPNATERKVLLFNCACSRRVWSYLDSADREAVIEAEAGIDDPAAIQELQRRLEPERKAALTLAGLGDFPVDEEMAELLRNQTELRLKLDGDCGYLIGSLAFAAARLGNQEVEEKKQSELVRCVFGNPFRLVICNPDSLTPAVCQLAEAIYADRAFERLPILADALEEAGCTVAAILEHCRGPGPHVRGCWVVDLLLGRS